MALPVEAEKLVGVPYYSDFVLLSMFLNMAAQAFLALHPAERYHKKLLLSLAGGVQEGCDSQRS